MNKLFEYVICFSLVVAAFASNCFFPTQSDPQYVQTQLKRLDSLRNKTFVTNYEVGGKKLTFKFRLCDVPSPTVCTAFPVSNVVVEEGETCRGSIGTFSNAFITSGSNWVSVTYSGGDAMNLQNCTAPLLQSSTVVFVCDPKSKDFSIAHTNRDKVQEQWHYSFVLNTDDLCDKPPVKGLSAGSVFCIIFFTVAGMYFFFGFMYRRFVVRAKGVEQIPNYDMWKEFGNLVADGCDYMCRCGTRQESKMYQGIGDPLGNEESESEERDDRLLPM